jgi:hypothetical protein
MEYDRDKVDEVTLALLWLTPLQVGRRLASLEGHDWETMDRLHSKEFISDPRGKQKYG